MSLIAKKTSKRSKPKMGKFIVVDGTDGSGKATQTEMLIETLKHAGFPAVRLEFPRYTKISSALLQKYLAGDYGILEPHAASVLYAVDRFDAAEDIRAIMEEGNIVIADRYVTSNAGHQGAKIVSKNERIKYYRWLEQLEYNYFGIPRPDLNIILHVPTTVTAKLIAERSKRDNRSMDLHERDLEHLRAAERVYLEIAALFPNTKLVECVEKGKMLGRQQIHGKVWDLVRRIALKK
jgi:dTMP kinase